MPLSKRTLVALLFVIVLCGLVLRLLGLAWGHGYHQTGIGDELEAFRVALNYLEGDVKAQYLGQPNFNSGKIAGPLWAMLWSAPLRFGGSPVTVLLLILLLNTAVIPLVYLLARRLFGASCAPWAALFYAVSPWSVYFSVNTSNPSMMALLGVLLYLALWDVCNKPGSVHIFWVCLLLAAMPQFHMIGVFYIPFVLLIIGLSGNRINRKWLAVGVLAAGIVYLPYVSGEFSHRWENTRQILGGQMKFHFGVFKILTSQVNVLSNVITRWTGYHFSEYRAFGDAMLGSFYVLAAFNVISVVYGMLFLGAFLRDLFRSLRGRLFAPRQVFKSAPALTFTGVLLFGPLLLFLLTGHDFTSRYLFVQFPLLFCLPALFWLKALQAGRWRAVLVGGMVLTTVFNAAITPIFFYYQKSQFAQAAFFIPTFPRMEALYQTLRTDTPPGARISIQCEGPVAVKEGASFTAARFLADYVSMRDEQRFLSRKSQANRFYLLQPTTREHRSNCRTIYENNGIRLVAVPL